jgi:CubicO group peptidase (beta-lactamase class C family)
MNDAGSIFEIASVTKQFTATVVLKLAALHQLSLSDKLSKYYPGYPHGDSITIENLLTHTSGIWDYTHDRQFMYSKATQPMNEEKILALFKDKPLDFAPGKGWSYSNSGYSLLGYIIQKVTGLSYESAVRKYIFTPLQMNNSGFDFTHLISSQKTVGYYGDSTERPVKPAPIADSSIPFAAGAIYSTVGDLYKWHRGLQAYSIIGKELQQKAYTPFRNNYGYGWIIDSLERKLLVSHSGGIFGFRSNIARIPEDDVCVILLDNTEVPGMESITRNLFSVVYNKPYYLPGTLNEVLLPEVLLQQYTGTYEIVERKLIIDITVENGRLLASPHNGPRSVLCALDETHFFLKTEDEFKISFEKDTTGKVDKLLLDQNGRRGVAKKIK